jgi:AmmeMemoRadiSam system protein A
MCMTEVPGPLTAAEGREALALARRSLETWVRERRKLKLGRFTAGLASPCGAFVTLHTRDGKLRGCIGHMVGEGPVGELITELAIASGTQDSRFAPVTEDELGDLVYEISVLSPMLRTAAAEVKPGVHGLCIRRGRNSGVLLPQVATEWCWERDEFLCETCRKAGLPTDAWQDPRTEISTFTAQIFSESK